LNFADIHLPRELEADAGAAEIRRRLSARTVKLWAGGTHEAIVMPMSDPLKQALARARLKGHLRCGLEAIRERLGSEKKGIMNARKPGGASEGNRISRLILFSDDGAERLYRHIEQLIQDHSPRVLGCLLNIDSHGLGKLITGQDRRVKVLMVEHKEAVSELLRAVTTHPAPPDL
jgi:hypothetical protein